MGASASTRLTTSSSQLRHTSAMEEPAYSPWQAPPPFLVARLIGEWLSDEPRWPLLVADLSLVGREWRAAVADTLLALAPRPHIPANEVAAAAARLPALRLLRISSPSECRFARFSCYQVAAYGWHTYRLFSCDVLQARGLWGCRRLPPSRRLRWQPCAADALG